MITNAKNILVADDEVTNLDILSHSLTKNGYNVVCCKNGIEALSKLNEQPDFFDIALLDRMMPELNGVELLIKIKEDEKLKDIPVVIQSAKSLSEEIQEGLNAGAIEYLTKPYNTKDLLKALDSVSNKVTNNNEEKILDFVEFEIFDPIDIALTSLYIANLYPTPQKVQFEIKELIRIAIEQGNLGIDIALKTKLLEDNKYEEEIEKRLLDRKYMKHKTLIKFIKYNNKIVLKIKNDDDTIDWTIDWKKYYKVDENTVNNSKNLKSDAFSYIEFPDNVNEIHCTYTL